MELFEFDWSLSKMGRPIALVCALAISGCTTGLPGAVEGGIARAKMTADSAAAVFLADTCAMTLGAYHRLENPNHQLGADLICDPDINLSP